MLKNLYTTIIYYSYFLILNVSSQFKRKQKNNELHGKKQTHFCLIFFNAELHNPIIIQSKILYGALL